MTGMELSKAFYDTYGKPVLETEFADVMPYLAAGLFGSGSECFGYDDQVSRDHDFEPGFCLLLPGEELIDRKRAFQLERAYAKLPKEFMGFERARILPVGGARHGVLRIADVIREKTGTKDGCLSALQWLQVPEESLAEAVNGEIFYDGYGEVTRIRRNLSYYPEDIRLKKLAGALLLMAQAGQYNYQRCLLHGEQAAAQLAVCEFVKAAMHTVFLLNRRYQPYYKWSFRAMRALPRLPLLAELFEYLLTTDNEEESSQEKYNVMEGIAQDVIDELMEQGLTGAICQDLEKHAYSVNDHVQDAQVRNLHILAGV